jgi:hypothetical protein
MKIALTSTVLFLTLTISSSFASQRIVDVHFPKEEFTGLALSKKSSLDGVCKYLGHDSYLKNSVKYGSSMYSISHNKVIKINAMRIDSEGRSTKQVESFRIEFMRCLSSK